MANLRHIANAVILLVVVLIVGIAILYCAKARSARRLIAVIESVGGSVKDLTDSYGCPVGITLGSADQNASLSDNDLQAIVNALGQCPNVRSVDLQGTELTPRQITDIISSVDLIELRANDTRFDDTCIDTFDDTCIDTIVTRCQNLRLISIDRTRVTINGIRKLHKLKSLRFVGIRGFSFSDAERAELRAMWPERPSVSNPRSLSAGVVF